MLNNAKSDKILPIILLGLQVFISVFVISYFDGTGDSGDSIYHYLYSKYAPQNPVLYFDHWAKPFFTLLASPFAQFGIGGMKVFNASLFWLTCFVTVKTTQKLGIKNSWVTILILMFTPLYFVLTYSGLTEPLFALMSISGLYFISKRQNLIGSILISLLPFVRSEGLIIIGVFAVYFVYKKEWTNLIALTVGHILYSFAGYFIYKDILWVFTKIPYAKVSSIYGQGSLTHFIEQLYFSTGLPIYILFWLGSLTGLWLTIKKEITSEKLLLVYGCFFGFFVAHTLFWNLGIFNSMGLKRVLICIFPFLAIIGVIGMNYIIENTPSKLKRIPYIFFSILLLYVVIAPFTKSPSSVKWEKEMFLAQDQKVCKEVAEYILENKFNLTKRLLYIHPYLSESMNHDHFDPQKHIFLDQEAVLASNKNDIIIWDNWFCPVETNLHKEFLDRQKKSTLIHEIIKEGSHFSIYKINE